MSKLKYIWAIIAGIGGFTINLMGGWDTEIQTLAILMVSDIITGTLIALFWNKSPNSTRGAYDSNIAFQSGLKKMSVFLVIALAVLIDGLFASALGMSEFVRTSVILYYSGVEGASLVENLGIMGVPLPAIVINAFEQLQDRGRNGDV